MSDDAKEILAALQSGELPPVKAGETKGKEGVAFVRYNKDSRESAFPQVLESTVSYSFCLPSCGKAQRQGEKGDRKTSVMGREKTEGKGHNSDEG